MEHKKQPLKAVVMAGGEGTRLRPLTCGIPKPMAGLCGRPVIEFILELLAAHNVEQAVLTLMYLPEELRAHFPTGQYGGVKLSFVEEDLPLGTAGSVKNAAGGFDDDFFVISGDALCDFDLTAAYRFHTEGGYSATIVAKQVQDPREYGLIRRSGDHTVGGFIEKPAYSQAVSDLANTGVYILSRQCLDLIPDGAKYDFAQQLFPDMLERGMQIGVFEEKGYWCDIGDLTTYRRCQQDILSGAAPAHSLAYRDKKGNIVADPLPAGNYTVIPPIYCGRNVKIADGAVIDKGSVIGDGCIIGENAHITGAVLLDNCSVERAASVSGGIIGASAVCKAKSMVFEGAVLGSHSVLGRNARLNPGIKIWPRKVIGDGEVVDRHIKLSSQKSSCFDEDGISGSPGTELTAGLCTGIGAAAATVFGGERIAVGCSEEKSAKAMKQALISGSLCAGSDTMDFGDCTEGAFCFGMALCGLKAGVYISGGKDEKIGLRLYQEGALPAARAKERGVEMAIASGEFRHCTAQEFGENLQMQGIASLYLAALSKLLPEKSAGRDVAVVSDDPAIARILTQVIRPAGKDAELTVTVTADGGLTIEDNSGVVLEKHTLLGACCMEEFENGNSVAVGYDAPRVLDSLAQRYGVKLLRYLECPADDSDAAARKLASAQLWVRDPVMLALKALNMLEKKGATIAELAEKLPRFTVRTRTVAVQGGNPAGIVGHLSGPAERGGIGEGTLLRLEDGCVLIRPLKKGNGIKITAEAAKYEIAEELCGFFERLIQDDPTNTANLLDSEGGNVYN